MQDLQGGAKFPTGGDTPFHVRADSFEFFFAG
jgi:hypothetical protein